MFEELSKIDPHIFQNLFENSPIPIEIYNENGMLLSVNTACLKLFGIVSADELKAFQLFNDPNLPDYAKSKLKNGDTVSYLSEFDFELVKQRKLYRTTKAGKIYIEVLIKPFYLVESDRNPSFYLVHIQDITTRNKNEREKNILLKNLQDKIKEKEILLKEIHHRVKNNLQVISSLIILQLQNVDDLKSKNIFNEFLDRIKSISLIHDYLYRVDNLAKIDFNDYVGKLVENLRYSFKLEGNLIIFETHIENIYMNIDQAQVCGMILNELVTNALKHAFTQSGGKISISMERDDRNQFKLSVSDDGIGIYKNGDLKTFNTLGLRLVQNLIKQLKGTLEIQSINGTQIFISFIDK